MEDQADFVELSYQANQQHYHEAAERTVDDVSYALDPQRPGVWMMYRLLTAVCPFIDASPEDTWATLGDGSWGREAYFLRANGAKNVLATDIDTRLLKLSSDAGAIKQYQTENMEKLSFADSSLDYVMTKESVHHLARPYLALYEMFRVCKKAMIFLEPEDYWAPEDPALYAQARTQKETWELLSVEDGMAFEKCGNYAYFFSLREIEKFALGLNLKWIAYRGLVAAGIESMPSYQKEKHEEYRMDVDSAPVVELKNELSMREILSQKKLRQYGKYCWAIFKEDEIDPTLRSLMEKEDWVIKRLPDNPYGQAYQDMAALNSTSTDD